MGGAVNDPLTFHHGLVSASDRESLLGQRGCVLWLTGLSGSGKSTIARAVERRLVEAGRLAYVLDGDNVRHGLNADLGFSDADRVENIRRIGQVTALFADAGLIAITAFISPFRADRDQARALLPDGRFLEVFVDAPIEVCEQRDPKGLYRKAREGKIPEFTGITSPYEPPEAPELVVRTGELSIDEAAARIVELLERRGLIPHHPTEENPSR
ncbi:MAG: adenylyl-sulfate kinase [Acidobacteria bacterium]|nr:adenylyl-sulfate kinase [Acidobacteriota bacterium]